MKTITSVAIFCLPFVAGSVFADSFRCGTHLLQRGDNKLDVLQYCGEPLLKEVISGSDERRVEQWFYKPGTQQFTRILTFRGTILSNVETVTRR